MDFFIQLLVNGISIGFFYGLSAMGFVMIFKSSSVLNFAHGELLAFGAFLFLALITWAQAAAAGGLSGRPWPAVSRWDS